MGAGKETGQLSKRCLIYCDAPISEAFSPFESTGMRVFNVDHAVFSERNHNVTVDKNFPGEQAAVDNTVVNGNYRPLIADHFNTPR